MMRQSNWHSGVMRIVSRLSLIHIYALENGETDAIIAFTTDGRLSSPNIVLLQDDKHFFQTYYAGTIIRQDTLKKYPELRQVLMLMNNLISEKEMAAMNHEVETQKKNEADVARAFLIKKMCIRDRFETAEQTAAQYACILLDEALDALQLGILQEIEMLRCV